ncbi:S-DNA-T family DNA segregation ATPase FtsK/SpoIIIE [Amycolatopsis lexingtonensis]|uniref:S-DNA-T family DNA segregation ATPase FtsK/SpoIIIE n=1 Tax=Amycolatopsis lexingtonensis TaxID=218822 RepID=A0ABR9HX83_9PSEU|nr:type VII secretion protein EccCa [Amycolatopsis lexingtonensis]MBE1495544.1 S-DNA-T family DNA segregation ATPase FtsK/SpoIIIE [Amycolatopsis lexingtonensis]
MATIVVKRPARRPSPELPSGELILQAPPEIPAPPARQWAQLLMVLPMVGTTGAMMLMFSGSAGGSVRYAVFGLMGVGMLGMVVMGLLQGGGPSRREMGYARRKYLRHLAQHRLRLRRSVRRQREAMEYLHPDPASLWSLAASYRLWERRKDDADFGVARIGRGAQGPATTLVAPDTKPLEELEPLSALALRRFITTYSTVDRLPLAIAVNGFSRIHVRGDREAALGLLRAMLAQLATLQSPDDLRMAVCLSDDRRGDWDWVKWLPHALHPERADALGPLRLVAPTIPALESVLEEELAKRPRFDPESDGRVPGPHIVVVLDGGSVAGSDHLMTGGGVEGVTVVDLTTMPPRALDRTTVVLAVDDGGDLVSETIDGEAPLGRADALGPRAAEGLARQLAPLRLTVGRGGDAPMTAELGLAELLGLGDPYAFDPADTWVPRPNRDRLRVQFGIQADGTPIELDLKESAQDGMGPHGLLIGATGSGKSELLRTLVLALAVTHPPNSLNFALVDFKGGATFTRLDALPHTSAVITNLADELHLVDRMTDAINGELIRRQELLRAAGNFASLRDYEKARVAGAPLPEVPTLLVICDEFSELLSAKPDFIDMFVQIGRVGRSLGVHLLLASQRLEEGRLRGLESHLSYRVGLRTFSEMESRAVLGHPEAFRLPRAPGHGFLKVGTDQLDRFRSAYVSGVHQRAATGGVRPVTPADQLTLREYTTAYVAGELDTGEAEPEPADEPATGETLLDILVDRLTGQGTPAHQVWLPPLSDSPTLDRLLPGLAVDRQRGLTAGAPGALRPVLGIVDRPFEQRRDPLVLDLSGAAGHVLVLGAPQAGKSTALRTLITSLALTHTPREAQFYCLDFGGGTLASIAGLPHVSGVSGRLDTGAVRRTVAEVADLLARRERLFAEHRIDGIATYRRLRAEGRFAELPHGDVFLVIDGWQTLRTDFPELEEAVGDLTARGLSYGVHVVASCARAFDLRMNIRDLFASRLELKIGDPIDSIIDRRAAMSVPADAPGSGISPTGHQMLVALPRIDGVSAAGDLADGTGALVEAVRTAWPGELAPPVRLLPTQLPYAELPAADELTGEHAGLAVGIHEHDLSPLRLDFAADPHFFLLADAQSGKTSFLRALAKRIQGAYRPGEARIIVVDHRRGLLGEVADEYLLGFGVNDEHSGGMLTETAEALTKRLPGPDVTPEQLRARNWWQGPEIFVLVDDYDMVATHRDHPLMPLLPLVAQASDIGLHVVLARRTGGAGRGLFEPFLGRLREVGTPGLMMSGDRDEGPLLGGMRAQVLPPGRGWLVDRRGGKGLVQLAWHPPTT